MRSLFFASVALGLASAAAAQPAQPQSAPAPAPQAAAKPQTIKKVVCQRVDDEETTGSRLSAAPKKCKTIEVPAGGSGGGSSNSPSPERGER